MQTQQHTNNKRLREAGLTRLTQTRRTPPTPSVGGTTGYSVSQRRQSITLFQAALPLAPPGHHQDAPSETSVNRWLRNGVAPKHPTGNKPVQKLHGINVFLLCFYRMVYPRAQADEVMRYLFENSPDPKLFTRSQICNKEMI
jgi:hypothetical protein